MDERADLQAMETEHSDHPVQPGTDDPREPDVDGDQPDPVTLSEPAYDDKGLLRWASLRKPPAAA